MEAEKHSFVIHLGSTLLDFIGLHVALFTFRSCIIIIVVVDFVLFQLEEEGCFFLTKISVEVQTNHYLIAEGRGFFP